jgi:hypothetical protein
MFRLSAALLLLVTAALPAQARDAAVASTTTATGTPTAEFEKYLFLDQMATMTRSLRELKKSKPDYLLVQWGHTVAAQPRYAQQGASPFAGYEAVRAGLQPRLAQAAAMTDPAAARAELSKIIDAATAGLRSALAEVKQPDAPAPDAAVGSAAQFYGTAPSNTSKNLPELARVTAQLSLAVFAAYQKAVLHGAAMNPPGDGKPAIQVNDESARYHAARKSKVLADKQGYLTWFSANVAPKLRREVDFLQYLAVRLSYLHMPVGSKLGAAIQSLQINPDAAPGTEDHWGYAHQYQVADIVAEKGGGSSGVVAYLLSPVNEPKRASIILFRGTSAGVWEDAVSKQLGWTTGLRADIDAKGIGYSAFANNSAKLRGWLARAPGMVTILGHSLGGAFAQRLAASIEAKDWARVRLVTFEAPGIDKATVVAALQRRSYVPPSVSRVLHGRISGDFIPRAGEQHLFGAFLQHTKVSWDPFTTHNSFPDAAWAMQGHLDSDKGESVLWWQEHDVARWEEIFRGIPATVVTDVTAVISAVRNAAREHPHSFLERLLGN